MIFKEISRSIPISKEMVWNAYKTVKTKGQSGGVDTQSLLDFEKVRSKELYKIWNRMSSGSYMANKIRRVEIPKSDGSLRKLGIPTISDRIAQQVIKTYLEPRLEKEFEDSSYGYRPNRSAHQAIQQVQKYVQTYNWALDLDISNFFDEVNHELLYKAIDKHVPESWVKMYLKRWLTTSIQLPDGSVMESKGKGVPQGGVISPLLSNLFLHYVLDKWLILYHDNIKMVRYADDIIVHTKTQKEAERMLSLISNRLNSCGLSLHPIKTRIVYCKKSGRRGDYQHVQFDFLGFSFQPIRFQLRRGGSFLQYGCKMSRKSKQRILKEIRLMNLHRRSRSTLEDLAAILNPKIRGWINYYGKISKNSLRPIFYHLHHRLLKWILHRYKGFKRSKKRAVIWLRKITKSYPNMFYHWSLGYTLT